MTTTPDTKELFELYDLMESRLGKLGMNFDEFTILYKSFKNTPINVKVEAKAPNPFPWAKHAGQGSFK